MAVNNSSISKYSYSHINKSEIFQEEKNHEQKKFKKSISLNTKKNIKNELLTKKYSKRAKITWKTSSEVNNSYLSELLEGTRNYKENSCFLKTQNHSKGQQEDIHMG